MYIDGEIYLADAGMVERFVGGRRATGGPDEPATTRSCGRRRLHGSSRRRGRAARERSTAYDPGSDRIVAFDKASGEYQAQYRIANGGPAWADLRGFYVVNRANGQAPVVYWIDEQRIGAATLAGHRRAARRRPRRRRAARRVSGRLGAPTPKPAGRRPRPLRSACRARPAAAGGPSGSIGAWDNPPMGGRLVEMAVESVRVHMLSTQHVVILKELGARPLPADLDRAVGGERDRHEAPGPGPGAAADPRPVRRAPRGAGRHDPPGRDRGPRRRDLPRPDPAGGGGRSRSRSTRGRPTPSPWPSGPGCGSSPRRRSSTAPAWTSDRADERRARRRGAPLGLPRLRELARRRAGHRRAPGGAAARNRRRTGVRPRAVGLHDRLAAAQRAGPVRPTGAGAGSRSPSRRARRPTAGRRSGEPAVRG